MVIDTKNGTMSVREFASMRGRIGGAARAAALTPKRRAEIARMGGKMRMKMKRIRESTGALPVVNHEFVTVPKTV